MQNTNTILDDVCALIGFSATIRLIEWHGGKHVHVPQKPEAAHPLAKLLGFAALRNLTAEFGGSSLWVPKDPVQKHRRSLEVKKQVATLLSAGAENQEVATALRLSVRQVQRIKKQLAGAGVL